ncbi:hypothetical protein DPMN_111792 [Dreissena polymorpha]|uniref:Uncharacterized protein n=1 Tax=Dreissena polymorpha TaxID=45954 RepID=A0A9D4KF49_DREPO|nr:hypothetical protein DPMN_111792 [Dreissena polymorpha]
MWMDGRQKKTNPKTSSEQSAIFQLVREINKTNAKNVTSISHISHIKETNVLTKFHENWAKNVTSRKNAPPTGDHVFSPIWTIFELVTYFELDRDIIGTKLLTKFHEDRKRNVPSRVFTNKC